MPISVTIVRTEFLEAPKVIAGTFQSLVKSVVLVPIATIVTTVVIHVPIRIITTEILNWL